MSNISQMRICMKAFIRSSVMIKCICNKDKKKTKDERLKTKDFLIVHGL